MEIRCPVCNLLPPVKRWQAEELIAYGYRKWRWLSNHMASDHLRDASLRNRRMEARGKQLKIVRSRKTKVA